MRAVFIVAVIVASTGCTRLIKLPSTVGQVEPVGTFEYGVNARTALLGYEVPGVSNTQTKAKGFSIGGFGRENSSEHRKLEVKRPGKPSLEVDCELSMLSGNWRYTKNGLSCTGQFDVRLDEPRVDSFVGTARLGDIVLDIESTDEMLKGPRMGPSGFHLRRNGRWLGSFEYFQFGHAYLAQDLSADERDTVLTTMVVVQSSDQRLAKSPSSSSGF